MQSLMVSSPLLGISKPDSQGERARVHGSDMSMAGQTGQIPFTRVLSEEQIENSRILFSERRAGFQILTM